MAAAPFPARTRDAPADAAYEAAVLQPAGGLVPGVERIAVLRANAIGDFVLAVPALAALRATYASAEITYLGTATHDELLTGRPGPWDRVVVVPPYPGEHDGADADVDSSRTRKFFAEQRAAGYDLAVQLHGGGANSNPFVTALGARTSVGSRDVGAPPLDRWTPYAGYQHEIIRFLEVVGLAGAAPVTLDPRLDVTAADRSAATAALGSLRGPLVAVHAGATDPRRRWPPAAFATVADRLAARGATIVLIGEGSADEEAAASIAEAMSAVPVRLVGQLSFGALLGVLERCRLLVGNDSGPRHLAAAVGTATVGVYYVVNLVNAGPLTRARHRVGVSFRTACPVCGLDQSAGRCEHDPSFVADVPVDEIATAAIDLYDAEADRR